MMTTPPIDSDSVKLLQSAFRLAEEPRRVPVRTRADSIKDDCYKDVERQVSEFGGELVYGWQVWEWPRIMVEGEFHAVWRSPAGELVDVSFKRDGESEVVFIPDPSRTYNARQIDNIRLALWDHDIVHRYIRASAAIHKYFDDNRIGELKARVDGHHMAALETEKALLQQKLMSFPRARPRR